jgi:hypothetical protein
MIGDIYQPDSRLLSILRLFSLSFVYCCLYFFGFLFNTASIRATCSYFMFYLLHITISLHVCLAHVSHVSSMSSAMFSNDTACIYCDINKYRTCLRAVPLTGSAQASLPCM